ncbi:MAG: hypothetical protein KKD38_00255, partial [Candidatus Delongbacteria bacterium]|nr:hypothetical protein [Candidatus Delongbacteria bacterium]MCG2760573.1 hypothetical protein [Candidatus Delongbacteria bacterium]
DLIVKLNGKIKGIQDIEINRYIAKYYLNTDIAEKKHIRSICVAVIKDIFGLKIIEDKYIRFKNTDFMKIEDHAVEILEEVNCPMTLLEISEKFRESGLNSDLDSLRIALRNKKKFYAVKTDWNKRFNLYNLVKWKKNKKNSAVS